MAHAGTLGAVYNVRINLAEIQDEGWVQDVRGQLSALVESADAGAAEMRQLVDSRL